MAENASKIYFPQGYTQYLFRAGQQGFEGNKLREFYNELIRSGALGQRVQVLRQQYRISGPVHHSSLMSDYRPITYLTPQGAVSVELVGDFRIFDEDMLTGASMLEELSIGFQPPNHLEDNLIELAANFGAGINKYTMRNGQLESRQ